MWEIVDKIRILGGKWQLIYSEFCDIFGLFYFEIGFVLASIHAACCATLFMHSLGDKHLLLCRGR